MIKQLLIENKNWIIPNSYTVEPINRIFNNKQNNFNDGLIDLSITRTTFDWGIQFPNNSNHIIYV